jgi:purine nucleosidase
MTRFPTLPPYLMTERLALPKGKLRIVIDTDTANEIDDQFALAWALLRPEKLDVLAVTAEPFSFAHHLPELRAAEAAMLAGQAYPEHLVGGFQGWLARLHAQGRRVGDLALVGPAEGMELSYLRCAVCAARLSRRAGLYDRAADPRRHRCRPRHH